MENKLKNVLIDAVEKNLNKNEKVGLLFSGGLDSSIIGKILIDLNVDFVPITVGIKNSKDVIASKKMAKDFFKNHVIIDVNKKVIEKTIPEVIKIIDNSNVVDISVGCVTFLASKYASIFGLKKIISGLGSDEIFCGYKSHEVALDKGFEEVHKECEKRVMDVKKDLERDTKISKNFDIKIITPFLEKEVVELGININPKEKISSDSKKIILRKVAKKIDLPFDICERKKKAAQYGSGIQKIIKKISKKQGFETVGSFLNNVYKKQKGM